MKAHVTIADEGDLELIKRLEASAFVKLGTATHEQHWLGEINDILHLSKFVLDMGYALSLDIRRHTIEYEMSLVIENGYQINTE